MLVTPSKVADALDAGTPKEDLGVPDAIARKVTPNTAVDETKPLVVGDWLSDKDITAWLTDKLYHNEIGEPQAWTTTVIYIVPRLDKMKKYEDSVVVWLGGGSAYLLFIVTIKKGSTFCLWTTKWPWTTKCQHGPSKSGFGSRCPVLT